MSAAPYGSASILPITWAYIRMMGAAASEGHPQTAIASANYIARRLDRVLQCSTPARTAWWRTMHPRLARDHQDNQGDR